MKAVIQRVTKTVLKVDGELISEIGKGLVVYLGVQVGDVKESADYLAKKISGMRIFEDENGKMNLSVKDVGGEILVVSQFTLLADTSHGNRPGFTEAEKPDRANELYEYFVSLIQNAYGITAKKGVFGADMKIEQHNDGPVTILMDKRDV
ncbi:MAG: D-tyrosyl-tRNA(Tyr) deacylase [Clostridiales bacterium]|nr:D-tyrosyl-tRNA(Tyr) deacylase [Clostridiales bacterium]